MKKSGRTFKETSYKITPAFTNFPINALQSIKYVLTDIDDTLTCNGRLPAVAYSAMESLQQLGISVIPITGRPAGWCDHIARMWPVNGVIGENGAFYFYYDDSEKQMIRRYWKDSDQRSNDTVRLKEIEKRILHEVPGSAVSLDQPYREADLAIDFGEDVEHLGTRKIEKIVAIFNEAGATAKVSSIHVNGWFGDYDKLAMTRVFFHEVFDRDVAEINEQIIFTGDSPNDAPMFSFFTHSVGVANIMKFIDKLPEHEKPAWVTNHKGGYGFAEVAEKIVDGWKQ